MLGSLTLVPCGPCWAIMPGPTPPLEVETVAAEVLGGPPPPPPPPCGGWFKRPFKVGLSPGPPAEREEEKSFQRILTYTVKRAYTLLLLLMLLLLLLLLSSRLLLLLNLLT